MKAIAATISEEALAWVDSQIDKKRFRSRSHALDACVWIVKGHEDDKLVPATKYKKKEDTNKDDLRNIAKGFVDAVDNFIGAKK